VSDIPTLKRATSKRQTIRAEALRLFAERGVERVSIQDIATACAMAKPNLYAHYTSKDELVRELFEDGYRDYGRQMRAAIAAPAPFRVRLEALVRLICHLHDEDAQRFRFILMTQHANLPSAELGEANPVQIVIDLVAASMREGEIRARDPLLLAASIVGLVVQPATFLQYGRLHAPLAQFADEIVSMCMRVAA
jgi:AcrR family transcriptional regulator